MNRFIILSFFCLCLALVSCKEKKSDSDYSRAIGTERAIVIGTWNIAWLHSQDNAGEVGREQRDYDRLAVYARAVDADIIALQEVYGRAAAMRIFDPAVYDFHFPDDNNPQQVGFAYKKSLEVDKNPFYKRLGLGHLRNGADITLKLNGKKLRLLAVHLKSRCFGPELTGEGACKVLAKQLPILEEWIDARASEEVPFVVLGDFNRTFEAPDPFWPEIDDADPLNADLTSVNEGMLSDCWQGRYPKYIDHILLDRQAASWLDKGSYKQLVFRPEHKSKKRFLSDHCPISIELNIPSSL